MRLLLTTLLALVIATAVGLGLTYATATRGTDLGTLKIGAWTARPKSGTSDVDPYSRATIARSGELPIGTGDGITTAFQLVKRYASGSQTWVRAITKPVAGTVRIALDGAEQLGGWSVDTTTGVVTFATAPAEGVAITAGFEFDVPVRFDADALDVTLDLERLGSITSIPLLELRR